MYTLKPRKFRLLGLICYKQMTVICNNAVLTLVSGNAIDAFWHRHLCLVRMQEDTCRGRKSIRAFQRFSVSVVKRGCQFHL
jgi:hypothetical protein